MNSLVIDVVLNYALHAQVLLAGQTNVSLVHPWVLLALCEATFLRNAFKNALSHPIS